MLQSWGWTVEDSWAGSDASADDLVRGRWLPAWRGPACCCGQEALLARRPFSKQTMFLCGLPYLFFTPLWQVQPFYTQFRCPFSMTFFSHSWQNVSFSPSV